MCPRPEKRWFRWAPTVLQCQFLPDIEGKTMCATSNITVRPFTKIVYAQGYVWRATRRPLTASDTMYFSPHAIVRHYSCSVDRFPRMYRDDDGPKVTTNMRQSDRDQKQNYLLRKSQTHRTVTKERSNTSSNSACPVR